MKARASSFICLHWNPVLNKDASRMIQLLRNSVSTAPGNYTGFSIKNEWWLLTIKMPCDLLECLTLWCMVEPSPPAEATPKAKETAEFCFCSQKTFPSRTFMQYFQAASCCWQNDCHGKYRARFPLFSDSKSKNTGRNSIWGKNGFKKLFQSYQEALPRRYVALV